MSPGLYVVLVLCSTSGEVAKQGEHMNATYGGELRHAECVGVSPVRKTP
jgi:hypothetical protein